jgi:hypothetical protein
MKTAFYIAVPFFAIGVHVYAQQHNEAADRQPPVITEQQVEEHAEMAIAERREDEKTRYEPVKQKTEAEKDKPTPGPTDTKPSNKSSNKPEEQ